MVYLRFKAKAIRILKVLKIYGPVKNTIEYCCLFLRKYRIIARSRFVTFEHRYINCQADPNKKTVCVIVSCYNHLEYTKQAIDSYYAAIDDLHNYILIVMDDHSTDQTKSFFTQNARKYKNLCYFRYNNNMGLTQTWNDGTLFALKTLKADYIFIINNDVIMPEQTFYKLLTHFDRNKKIGAVGPLTNSPGYEPRQDIRHFYPAYRASDCRADVQATAEIIKHNRPVQLAHINGFFMGFPRKAFEKNIYSYILFKPYFFDPLNRNAGNEDEFLRRLKQGGFKILGAMDVFVFHYKDISQHRFAEGKVTRFRRDKNFSALNSIDET